MFNYSITELIVKKFSYVLYQKALNFPNNKINIIYLRENPIKINSIILDNDREYHLIINQKKKEIFHDCPSFLIYSEIEKKICIHLIKLLLLLKKSLSSEILNNFNEYNLTSEDFGSKKKSKNYLLLSKKCFESKSCIEGLNYLNKAIINQSQCEDIIERYLKISIENYLFLEFFDFLRTGYENDLNNNFSKFFNYIESGFKRFLNYIAKFSFFDILNIIESLNIIFQFIDITFIKDLFDIFIKLIFSPNFNERYFSIYFIKKNLNKLTSLIPKFEDIIGGDYLLSFQNEILKYFFDEIQNLAFIDKLKIMKNHFQIFGISKDKFYSEYKQYKNEIRELEKKVYLKKFSYLKLLIEKHKISKTKGEFRKKRNTYIVKYDEINLKNPVYQYIISHIGFYGTESQTIKSNDIGINYFIIKELFIDNLENYPDIFYYKNQFWGDVDKNYKINSIEGVSLFSENITYSYDIDNILVNIDDIFIIEWDLANKPRQASIVNAYGSQIIIPDQNSPLYHDLKPFDLCYCYKNPIKIEGNIKIINIISKCSFKDAIIAISKGMHFIEGYYPLSLVKAVNNKELSPFKAFEIATNNQNKIFIPNYKYFIKSLRVFLFDFINKEKEYIFNEIKADPENKGNQIITLLNLSNQLNGIDLPYFEIIKKLLVQNLDIYFFKLEFLNEIHKKIKEILKNKELGSTIIFDLKKMKNTPFAKYSNEIISVRKEEFESKKIYKVQKEEELIFDIIEILDTYYGKKFAKILKIDDRTYIKPDKFKKLITYSSKLDLNLHIINNTN